MKTLMERRGMLETIIKPAGGIQLGNVEGKGKALFELTKSKGMEGIVAKRKDSVYRKPEVFRRLAYWNGRLHYFGHSGSGFSEKGGEMRSTA
jgi:hypothetical protein